MADAMTGVTPLPLVTEPRVFDLREKLLALVKLVIRFRTLTPDEQDRFIAACLNRLPVELTHAWDVLASELQAEPAAEAAPAPAPAPHANQQAYYVGDPFGSAALAKQNEKQRLYDEFAASRARARGGK